MSASVTLQSCVILPPTTLRFCTPKRTTLHFLRPSCPVPQFASAMHMLGYRTNTTPAPLFLGCTTTTSSAHHFSLFFSTPFHFLVKRWGIVLHLRCPLRFASSLHRRCIVRFASETVKEENKGTLRRCETLNLQIWSPFNQQMG